MLIVRLNQFELVRQTKRMKFRCEKELCKKILHVVFHEVQVEVCQDLIDMFQFDLNIVYFHVVIDLLFEYFSRNLHHNSSKKIKENIFEVFRLLYYG